MRSRPRILILDNSVAVTGALISALRSSRVLSEKFDFLFMLPTGSQGVAVVVREGFRVLELPMRELGRRGSSWILYLPSLFVNLLRFRLQLRRHQVDLVMVNDFYNLLPAMSRLIGGTIPYITYIRFMPDRFPSALVGIWLYLHYKFSDRVIAVSRAVERKLKPNVKLTVIHNELPLVETPFIEPSNCRLLYLSNYIPGKGQDVALNLFARLTKDFPSWHIRFVGGDMGLLKNTEYKKHLQELARQLNIDHLVEWASHTDNVGSEYLASGIVLNLSESESFSMTCLEAMYYGRCVVATRSGGPEEIIDDGVTGILVHKDDPDQLTVQLQQLMADSNLRTAIGRNAFDESRRRFNVSQTTAKLEQVYLDCLARIKN